MTQRHCTSAGDRQVPQSSPQLRQSVWRLEHKYSPRQTSYWTVTLCYCDIYADIYHLQFSYNIFCVHLIAHTHLNHTVPEDSLKTLIKELFCATLKLRCKDCKHKLMTWPIFRPILNASPCCWHCQEAGWSWGCSRSALAACCSCSCYPAPFLSDATLTFQPLRWVRC